MTDLVELARRRREEVRAEVEALNRFLATATRLLRSDRSATLHDSRSGVETPVLTEGFSPRNGVSAARQLFARAAGRPPEAAPARADEAPARGTAAHAVPAAARPEAPASDWMRDTFDFRGLAAGTA